MELKLMNSKTPFLPDNPSNCTNMELKPPKEDPEQQKRDTSNCTNMELKLHTLLFHMAGHRLLIAPIWN